MTKEDMVILIEIADATRKITEFFMGSDDMKGNSKGILQTLDKVYDVIFDNVGSKLAAIEDEDDRDCAVIDIVYDYEKTAVEKAEEILMPLECRK